MTDTINQVREALESAKVWHEAADKAISKQPNANQGHNGWMRLEHQEQARLLGEALSLLSQPAPDVPGAEEVEAIRARHDGVDKILKAMGHNTGTMAEAHTDRATLLRALDAERARRVEVEKLIRVLLENEPDDLVSDGGHTVLDLWRHEARATLTKETP